MTPGTTDDHRTATRRARGDRGGARVSPVIGAVVLAAAVAVFAVYGTHTFTVLQRLV